MEECSGLSEGMVASVPVEEVTKRAREVQEMAGSYLTFFEWREQRQLARMVRDPQGRATFTAFVDRLFRAQDPRVTTDALIHLLEVHGIPRFLGFFEQVGMRLFQWFGEVFPSIVVPFVKSITRGKTRRVIIPGEEKLLHRHLRRRMREGVRMNMNIVGDDVLGDAEAAAHLLAYTEALRDPLINTISVKLSTLYPHVSSLAHDHTVEVSTAKLCELLDVARQYPWMHPDGTFTSKFINVDMEEYRDLPITIDAFTRALEKYPDVSAGLVLQAYLPDSFPALRDITAWARERVRRGGAPIKVRIVKGANMEMEKVEASVRGWPRSPYLEKWETDANYYAILCDALQPENTAAVHLGVASHNIFTIAHAALLAEARGIPRAQYTFEMLEGMANHVQRSVREFFGNVLLYAPVARREHVLSTLGYLTRRLDENTAAENFLSRSFGLKVGSPAWSVEAKLYERACSGNVSNLPRRQQNRLAEEAPVTLLTDPFRNEPDTDFTLRQNREWIERVRAKWMERSGREAGGAPIVIGNGEIWVPGSVKERWDPSRPSVIVSRRSEANVDDVRRALSYAKEDWDGWRSRSMQDRSEILLRSAQELRKHRGDLIGVALAEAGKVVTELDSEISEAIDFAEYYARSAYELSQLSNVKLTGRGVGVVVSPWHFPIAIPVGGICAALTANTVIVKPASDTALTAWELVSHLYSAGVPKSALQFLPCTSEAALSLVHHHDADFVIFTGGTETALRILEGKPSMRLFAETGGKNVTIVTPMADREQAIKHVLHSAFTHSGQKCSATSLFILVGEVYGDPKFKRQLKDAVESLPAGSAWEFQTTVNPLIRPPSGVLAEALERLGEGEEWLIKPQMSSGNPSLWKPGVKWGVRPGSLDHCTELFGPVLGVMRAENLEEAVALARQTGYGLTAGLESLDERDQEFFIAHMRVGNLYVNRPTTGAITGRQPFGGMGKSAIGLGVKAGGPNYVLQFMEVEEVGFPSVGVIHPEGRSAQLLRATEEWEQELHGGRVLWHEAQDMPKGIAAIRSYLWHVQEHFGKEHLLQEIRGEDNIFRYLPIGRVTVRVHPDDSFFDVLARVGAAVATGNCCTVSVPSSLSSSIARFLEERCKAFSGGFEVVRESDEELTKWMHYGNRIRYAHPKRVPDSVLLEAAKRGIVISRDPPLMEGRIELARSGYYEEQAISTRYHRYGNLLWRGIIHNHAF